MVFLHGSHAFMHYSMNSDPFGGMLVLPSQASMDCPFIMLWGMRKLASLVCLHPFHAPFTHNTFTCLAVTCRGLLVSSLALSAISLAVPAYS